MVVEESPEIAETGPVTPAVKSALRYYTASFALLGFAVGFFAGASRSPVVATLLPLLFGLVGGAGGLYLARADLTKPDSAFRLRAIGIALSVFIVFTVAGSAYGISLRTGRSLGDFFSAELVSSRQSQSLPDIHLKDPKQTLALLTLRARVRALGASENEQRQIMETAVASLTSEDSASDAASLLRQLAQVVAESRDEVGKAMMASEETPDLAGFLVRYLEAYSKDYREWAAQFEKGGRVSVPFVIRRIDGLQETIDKNIEWRGVAHWLALHDDARRAIWALQHELMSARHKLRLFQGLDLGLQAEDTDRFLSAINATIQPRTPADGSKLPQVAFEP